LSPFRISVVSVSTTFHACLRSDGTTRLAWLLDVQDMIDVPVTNEPMMWLGWLGSGISKCQPEAKVDVRSVRDGSDE